MSLLDSLGAILGSTKGRKCPDCGSMMEDGECPECGYGSEMEDEMDDTHESIETQNLLDLRDALQNCVKIVDRMIVNQSTEEDDDKEEAPAQPTTIVWTRQR